MSQDGVVLIGKKPVMNYVTACVTFFNAGSGKITLKARGRAITTAVDTVELLKRAFLKDLEVQSINLNSEELTNPEGRTSKVSTIEITITRKGK